MKTVRLIVALTVLALLVPAMALAQVDIYARSATIPNPLTDVGWGNAIAGVDFDGDGNTEIYAVNTNMYDQAQELPPRIYKYEYVDSTSSWTVVWSADLAIPAQNTWPALTYGDMDGDGKMEVIFGPPNNLVSGNETPDRVFVFEEAGDGSDVMGVVSGNTYAPNATFKIDTTASYEIRPFKWVLTDMDGDGTLELVFADRRSNWECGVLSVSDIPDNGDGSETWTVEFSGVGINDAPGTFYDMFVIDSTAWFISSSGNVQALRYRNGAYAMDSTWQEGIIPGGAWKSASVVDLDNDGTKEVIVGGGGVSTGAADDVYLFQMSGDTIKATIVASVTSSGRAFFGGTSGDIDGDGNMDFVFGSRSTTPGGQVHLVSYNGGAIDNSASYTVTKIEEGYGSGSERYDIFAMFNADSDPELEILYGMGYGGPFDIPLVLLDKTTIPVAPTDIATVRTDTDGDGVPDSMGVNYGIIGTVVSINFGGGGYGSYHLQDATGGINAYINTSSRPDLAFGDRVYLYGPLGAYNGLDEIIVATDSASLATNIVKLGPTYSVSPISVTLEEFLANPESYESRYIKITGLSKKATSNAWPIAGASSTNMSFWDGYSSVTVRIDSDTDIRGTTEPTYPVDIVGIGSQYDSSVPRTSGYQIFPNKRTDFTEGVAVSPNRHFDLVLPTDGSTLTLSDAFIQPFSWNAAVDLNGDALQYQWVPVGGTPVASGNSAADTFLVRTGVDLKAFLGAADTVVLQWTVLVKDAGPVVNNADTFSVTIVRGTITGVAESGIPTEFALQQNYPNPFNPTTTIEYALPTAANVTLRVYNMLGQEVANLVNETRPAGFLRVVWNGRDAYGSQVASGTYLYRIEARAVDGSKVFVQNRKMILLK